MIVDILIVVGVIIGIMYLFGLAFQTDLKILEKTNPKFRKHLKDKYNI